MNCASLTLIGTHLWMDNTGFNQVLQYKEYSTSRFRDAASHICASHWTSFYNSALPIRFFAKMPQSVRLLLSHWEGKKTKERLLIPTLDLSVLWILWHRLSHTRRWGGRLMSTNCSKSSSERHGSFSCPHLNVFLAFTQKRFESTI